MRKYWSILIALLTVAMVTNSTSTLPLAEMQALHQLHDDTGGEWWAWKEPESEFGMRWNFTQNASSGEYLRNPCSDDNATAWQGITCSDTPIQCAAQVCHIVLLDLNNYNLHGTLSSSLGNLTHLESLAFYYNSLYGSIPNLGALLNLELLDYYGNQLSGEIPTSLSQLPALRYLYLGVNNLHGPLEPLLGQLQNMEFLSLQNNMFTGTIIPELGQLGKLRYIYLNGNFLEGSLPSEMGQWTNMEYLSLYDLYLTGPLIPEIGQFVKMHTMYLSDNLLTGPLNLGGQLVQLRYLLVYNNMLTGPLPDLSHQVHLQYLSVYNNMFTGSISSSLGNLVELEYLSLFNNLFTGKLIPELGVLVKLEYVTLKSNMFTGPLVPELGELKELNLLNLAENQFTGALLSEFGQLTLLEELRLYSNHFESKLPSELSQCMQLRILQVQDNFLSGSLEGVFLGRMVIENLDLSNNKFSGNIPQDIFNLPVIRAIALSLNCFEGTLPVGMCEARTVGVLSMDGLGAALDCKHSFTVPLTGVTLFNTMEGSIPACVWSALPLLTVLHLTGNGLSGSISDTIPTSSSLKNISLGTIPASVQAIAFDYLDLSYNKLTGGYSGHAESAASNSSRLFLEVNRLSGRFPASFGSVIVTELSALRGNLFGCGSLPGKDAYRDEYTCGSEELDVSLYWVMALLVFLVTVRYLFFEISRRNFIQNTRTLELYRLLTNLKKYFVYLEISPVRHSSFSFPSMPTTTPTIFSVTRIRTFGHELNMSTKLFWILLCIHLTTCIPLYGLKIAEYGDTHAPHMTHSYQYRWLLSLTYMRGELPLVFLLFMWASSICALRLLTARDGPIYKWFPWLSDFIKVRHLSGDGSDVRIEVARRSSGSGGEDDLNLSKKIRYAMYLFILMINVTIVGCVNGVYVHFSSQALPPTLLVSMQICLALFKITWNMVVVPVLSRPLRGVEKIVKIELYLRIINDIFLPCIVVALTSPACFQGFLIEPEEVTSTYEYTFCDRRIVSSGLCLEYDTLEIEVAPLIPPFSYNNLCSSVVLTSYIPVFLFVYSIQIIVPIVYVCFFTSITYASVPNAFQKVIQGVFWPAHWEKREAGNVGETGNTVTSDTSVAGVDSSCPSADRREDDRGVGDMQNCAEPFKLLKADRIISSDILNHLLLLCTYGMCSPFLSLAIVLSASLKQCMWVMLLGRFVDMRGGDGGDGIADYHPRGQDNARNTAGSVAVKLGSANVHELSSGGSGSGEVFVSGVGTGAGTDACVDHAIVALGVACVPILDIVTHCVWPIIWSSAVFFSFLSWDILGDALSWKFSLLAPLLTMSIPVCLWLSLKARVVLCSYNGAGAGGGRSASEANVIAMGRLDKTNNKSMEVICNPLQEK